MGKIEKVQRTNLGSLAHVGGLKLKNKNHFDKLSLACPPPPGGWGRELNVLGSVSIHYSILNDQHTMADSEIYNVVNSES